MCPRWLVRFVRRPDAHSTPAPGKTTGVTLILQGLSEMGVRTAPEPHGGDVQPSRIVRLRVSDMIFGCWLFCLLPGFSDQARSNNVYRLALIALVSTTALLLALAAFAWFYQDRRGAKVFVVLEVVSAAWVGLTALGLATSTGPLRLRMFGGTTGLGLLVTVFWAAFILCYTGRSSWLRPRRLCIALFPLLVGAGLYFAVPTWTPLVGVVSQTAVPTGSVVTATVGPVGHAVTVYVYLVFLFGLGLVVKTALEGSRLFVGQALAFTAGSLIPICASVLVVLDVNPGGYPLAQLALGPQSALWGYAIFGQQLLRAVPAVAEIGERAVFDDLDDGVLVVNDDGTIVRTNPRVQAYLNAPDLTGAPVTAILDTMDVDSLAQLPTRFSCRNQTFRATSSVIRDWQGEPIGRAIILTDITNLVTREQRLTVLNRLLRHNVRNDVNIVLAVGQQLRTRDTDELASYGRTLTRTARQLEGVSEKALELNRMFERSTATDTVALGELTTDIVSRLGGDYPDAAIDASVAAAPVRTDARILREIVEEVVANALEHAGESPAVRIEAQPADEHVALVIADDGPGIPQSEVQPLRDGEETALKHTSSFGLWFVKWGMQKIGGSVDITVTATGTKVTLRIPDKIDSTGDTRTETVADEAMR